MESIKVHILFDFVTGPWGGGNQFLKALKKYFLVRGVYSEDADDTDIVLLNSFDKVGEGIRLKRRNHNLVFIHRIEIVVLR